MEFWLSTSPVPGVILWVIPYISDYYLTIYSARGFREVGHFHFFHGHIICISACSCYWRLLST